MAARQETKAANPVFMCVVERPHDLVGLQVPLLDARVSRGAEKHVVLQREALDAVVVRRLKVGRRGHHATLAVEDVEDLDGVVFGPGDHIIPT